MADIIVLYNAGKMIQNIQLQIILAMRVFLPPIIMNGIMNVFRNVLIIYFQIILKKLKVIIVVIMMISIIVQINVKPDLIIIGQT